MQIIRCHCNIFMMCITILLLFAVIDLLSPTALPLIPFIPHFLSPPFSMPSIPLPSLEPSPTFMYTLFPLHHRLLSTFIFHIKTHTRTCMFI